MKKLTAIFVLFTFIFSQGSCFAFEELHYLKNTNVYIVKSLIEEAISGKGYQIENKSPYLLKSTKDSGEEIGIVVQQSGENLFYYYEAKKDKTLNKNIKKAISDLNIVSEQSQNDVLIANFARRVSDAKSPVTDKYSVANLNTFTATATKTVEQSSTTTSGKILTIPKNEVMNAYLQSAINTATASKNDTLIAVVSKDFKYDNYVVIPQGSIVEGIVTKANHATVGSRNGRVVIDFNKITTPEGRTFNVSLDNLDFTITNEGKIGKTVGSAVGAAVVGALLGVVFSAISGDASHIARGAIIGASSGAILGAGGAMIEKGVDAEIPAFTDVDLVLKKPITLVAY